MKGKANYFSPNPVMIILSQTIPAGPVVDSIAVKGVGCKHALRQVPRARGLFQEP